MKKVKKTNKIVLLKWNKIAINILHATGQRTVSATHYNIALSTKVYTDV